MAKRTLNLNKIKLYCILNNVKSWLEVPSCHNCKFKESCRESYTYSPNTDKHIDFSYDNKFKKFSLGKRLLIKDEGCGEWKRKN